MASGSSGRSIPILVCSTCGKNIVLGERVKIQVSWEKQNIYQNVGSSALVCRECGEKFVHACGMDIPEPMWSLL